MNLKNVIRNIYSICFLLNLELLVICNLTTTNYAQLIFFLSGFLSLVLLLLAIKKEKIWITPVNIFLLVWMVLIPLTSGPCPLMDQMTLLQINTCLISNVFFCLGGFFGTRLSFVSPRQRRNKQDLNLNISRITYQTCMFLIMLSLVVFIILIRLNGIPFFASDTNAARRTFYNMPFSSFFHMLGIPAAYIIFSDSKFRKKRLFLLFFFLYSISLLLIGVRFVLALELLMILSSLEDSNNRLSVKKVAELLIIGVAVFYLITSIRGGINDKQKFFINTGIYSGRAEDLVRTEIVRYFGMSQRVMEQYFRNYAPGCTKGLFTFYPILKKVFSPEKIIGNGVNIYGYTATNIIAYLWMDFGYFCFFAWLLWSIVFNMIFLYYKQYSHSLIIRYLWAIIVFSLFMSFYSYVDSIAYWCFEFPILIFIIQDINSKLVQNEK